MRRITLIAILVVLGLQSVEPAFARRRVVVHRGPNRTRVVVHRGHPIRRALPVVVVHPARRAVVVAPAVFLAPVVWTATVVALPGRDALVWEDSETLSKEEGWTDFTLNVEDRGTKLYLEIAGKAQLNFAEVVFENGDTGVVDFRENTRGPGFYSLLDFRDGRKVDHVRLVARAKSDEARIIVRMAR